MACEMNYKSLSIVIINSYINDNYESPMNQPINNKLLKVVIRIYVSSK
jgi:hypothetical protein